ncbi:glycosyltransferase [Spongiibacter marinus]|uniref:glycosyltransferase n=1 Tax=Spongiibacter marinus TaxID=354246 RepID=UPI001961A390|nr:glycosyltransferase [Spongiibacter marinus]MBM7424649.1 glycosyltransferase involved in cell wall biosynthesis [Spongiibacter marinus]
MKVAIVHDWLTDLGGAEKVLSVLFKIYPQADIFTLVDALTEGQRTYIFGERMPKINQSFLGKSKFFRKRFRKFLALFPFFIEQFDLSDYDLVISSSYCVAKGVLTGPDQVHISYCHSPARYAWDLQGQYLKESGLDSGLGGFFARLVLYFFRRWDVGSNNGVDLFLANSKYIKRRIKKVYGRDADVIYPPVSLGSEGAFLDRDDFYFTASRMVPYKKVKLIVEAFAAAEGRRLIVAGDGPEYKNIERFLNSRNVENVSLVGRVSDEELVTLMGSCKAFVYAAEEDFGIVPVEAQLLGTPVVCFSKGGGGETVVNGVTGVHFDDQSVVSILSALNDFEAGSFSHDEIRRKALSFSEVRFVDEFKCAVSKAISLRT